MSNTFWEEIVSINKLAAASFDDSVELPLDPFPTARLTVGGVYAPCAYCNVGAAADKHTKRHYSVRALSLGGSIEKSDINSEARFWRFSGTSFPGVGELVPAGSATDKNHQSI